MRLIGLFFIVSCIGGTDLCQGQDNPWVSIAYYDVSKKDFVSTHELMGKNGLALVFVGSHCPFVDAYMERIKKLQVMARSHGVNLVFVNSNSTIGEKIESLEFMRAESERLGVRYMSDQSQKIMRIFGATKNPEIIILQNKKSFPMVYRGAIDSSPLDSTPQTNFYADQAIKMVGAGSSAFYSKPAVGCLIK